MPSNGNWIRRHRSSCGGLDLLLRSSLGSIELATKLLHECPEVGSVIFEQSPKLCRVLGFFFTLAWLFVVRSHA
jgi:hypothetical protein